MTRTNVQDLIRAAIGKEIDVYKQEHPLLSDAIDRELGVEMCMRDLRDDPELRNASKQVALAGLAQEAFQGIVAKLTQLWLARV